MIMSLTQKDLKVGPFPISGGELVAQIVYESIKCKTWPTLPRKIDIIVAKVSELYHREFERISDDFYLRTFATYNELRDWLKENILAISEIEEMNLSQTEYEAGIKVGDEDRDKFVFSSRYSPACPINEDFVDLDAYVRNVCHDLIRSCIEINYSTFL
jgi:hypothetical protein